MAVQKKRTKYKYNGCNAIQETLRLTLSALAHVYRFVHNILITSAALLANEVEYKYYFRDRRSFKVTNSKRFI